MKSIRKLCYVALVVSMTLAPSGSKAQITLDSYFNVDWQFNVPIDNNFSSVASGWGMNFEGGYYVTRDIAVGAFISFHTNNEYFPRHTISLSPTLSMNSDQQHQMFTLPFGALLRYRFIEADFQPYAGIKLGDHIFNGFPDARVHGGAAFACAHLDGSLSNFVAFEEHFNN